MRSINLLYREVGRALHKAQLVEYEIVSALLLLSRTGPASDKEMREEYWSRMTLGTLLKCAAESESLQEDGRQFVKTVIAARNHLAHSFFVSSTEVHTQEGIAKLLREVDAMNDVFGRAYKFFAHVLASLAHQAGIDVDSLKEQSKAIVRRSSGNAESAD